ncbi:MAG: hypothetical protein ACREMB_10650, partial [Candidatus Rokuibacteriota bacterium]
ARVGVLAAALVAAGWLAQAIVSPAVGERLAATATTPAEHERALAWDPADPDMMRRAAAAYLDQRAGPDVERARWHLEAALRRRPGQGLLWLELALLADRAGEPARARALLASALRLDPHGVVLRWEAALLALRWDDRAAALDHLRYVLAVEPGQAEAAFQLARRVVDPGQRTEAVLPENPLVLSGLLAAAVERRDLGTADLVWTRRAVLATPIDGPLQRRYLDLLLAEGRGLRARVVWRAVMPAGLPRDAGNAVWNGGFEAERLVGWGLDWQVERSWGLDVDLDRFTAAEGRQSLRLSFNSFPTLDFEGVSQLVPVEPGRDYVLRARLRTHDFNTASGLKLQVTRPEEKGLVLAETATVAGTTPAWVPLEARVRTPGDASLVRILLRREKASAPEANIHGKVWVDDVSLVPAGSS